MDVCARTCFAANGRLAQNWQVVIVLFCFCVVCLIDVKKNWQAAAMAK